MGCISNLIYGLLQFAALVLVVIGVPFDQFRPRTVQNNLKKKYFSNSYCITMWGTKDKCYSLKYIDRPNDLFATCGSRPRYFRMAEVCGIVSIALVAAALLISALFSCCSCCGCKYICILLNVAAVVTLAICWGAMVDQYLQSNGYKKVNNLFSSNPCVRLRDYSGKYDVYLNGMRLGAGFICLVVSWALNIINPIILSIPCECT